MNEWMRRGAALSAAALMMMTSLPALAAEGTVNTTRLVLRKSPSQTSQALQTLEKGDSVTVQSQSGDWYKVRYGRYTGYVMKKYLKVSGKVDSETSSDEKASSATLRPGDKGSQVKELQQALRTLGLYKGKIDGVYGSGTTKAVKAFQKSKGLTQDGIAGSKTLAALRKAGQAGTTVTEQLTWFSAPDTIPKGAVVTIKDCQTGKTFRAKRWSGANHMDTEPLTRADTAVMKEIYGGQWSWSRRPILVQYNGHVYAASMNGMPHGTSTIDNGFDGHFCVHFLGSKTHETNRKDTEHQNAVMEAAQSSW
ncbi:MAG: peptidoglycan-binding protein [Aristaeellaceae bacterium]